MASAPLVPPLLCALLASSADRLAAQAPAENVAIISLWTSAAAVEVVTAAGPALSVPDALDGEAASVWLAVVSVSAPVLPDAAALATAGAFAFGLLARQAPEFAPFFACSCFTPVGGVTVALASAAALEFGFVALLWREEKFPLGAVELFAGAGVGGAPDAEACCAVGAELCCVAGGCGCGCGCVAGG